MPDVTCCVVGMVSLLGMRTILSALFSNKNIVIVFLRLDFSGHFKDN